MGIRVNPHYTRGQDLSRVRGKLNQITDATNKVSRSDDVVEEYKANYRRRRILLALHDAHPRLSAKALMRKARNG